MFDANLVTIAIVVLVALSVAGIVWALLFDRVDKDPAVERLERVLSHGREDDVTSPVIAAKSKRSLQSALKEFEEKQKARTDHKTRPPLGLRLTRAGLAWTKQTYVLFCVGLALATAVLVFVVSGKPLVALGGGVIGAFGLPNWVIAHLTKRRQKAFIAELPTAIDLIVRGVRSGLPLGDCLRVISTETREPVRSEFRTIVESQQLGIPVGEACMKLFERMPLQEANFFGIVIAIQQKAGGNLSEALANLSKVLRERKKMKEKIQAMSMEAKSSAAIIGSLPFLVSGLIYVTSPNYIMILFTTTAGNFIMIAGGLYMLIGILVMRQMINFDF